MAFIYTVFGASRSWKIFARPGGIDKLPADFKPKFNFVLSKTASGLQRAAKGREGWRRSKPSETVELFASNRCA